MAWWFLSRGRGREIVYWPVHANRKTLLVQGLTLDVIKLPLLKLRQILNGLKASVEA